LRRNIRRWNKTIKRKFEKRGVKLRKDADMKIKIITHIRFLHLFCLSSSCFIYRHFLFFGNKKNTNSKTLAKSEKKDEPSQIARSALYISNFTCKERWGKDKKRIHVSGKYISVCSQTVWNIGVKLKVEVFFFFTTGYLRAPESNLECGFLTWRFVE